MMRAAQALDLHAAVVHENGNATAVVRVRADPAAPHIVSAQFIDPQPPSAPHRVCRDQAERTTHAANSWDGADPVAGIEPRVQLGDLLSHRTNMLRTLNRLPATAPCRPIRTATCGPPVARRTLRTLGSADGRARCSTPACPETPIVGKVGVMPGNTTKRYPPELKERAVRMFEEIREGGSMYAPGKVCPMRADQAVVGSARGDAGGQVDSETCPVRSYTHR